MERDQIVEACARAAHEVNRVFCAALGDTSQTFWGEAEGWQKDAARKGTIRVLEGNTSVGDTHQEWMNDKLRDGWKFGPLKNPSKKEHPMLIPFNQLPLSEQAKDLLFIATVQSVASKLGYPIKGGLPHG